MCKLTLCVTFYNESSQIIKLLRAISTQTNSNYKLLIIDDGSDEKHLNILKSELKIMNNYKLFSKRNGGVSSARNFSLKKVETDWIIFLDGDDSISNDFVEKFYKSLINESVNLVITKHTKGIDRKPVRDIRDYRYTNCGAIWNKFFKINLIKNQFNENVFVGEDALFYNQYITDNKIVASRSTGTYYYQNSVSATRKNTIQKNYMTFLEVCKILEKEYNFKEKKYLIDFINLHLYIYTYVRVRLSKNNHNLLVWKEYTKKFRRRKILFRKGIILFFLSLLVKLHLERLIVPFAKLFIH